MTAPYPGADATTSSTCPSCNAALTQGAVFCASCGFKVSEPGGGRACTQCGTTNLPRANFCISCGARVGSSPEVEMITEDDENASSIKLVQLDDTGSPICRHSLAGAETTLGRENAHLTFADDTFLSPIHAQLSFKSDRLEIRDLGSRNGTWVFIEQPHRLQDGDRILIGSQIIIFRRLGYPGPHPPEADSTRRLGSLVPSADIASLTQQRSDGSSRDTLHLSPGRNVLIGREQGDWTFPYDPSMSGAHAEIRSEDADFVLVDIGSRNGSAIAVRGEWPLHDGSRFLVGDKMLRVEKV